MSEYFNFNLEGKKKAAAVTPVKSGGGCLVIFCSLHNILVSMLYHDHSFLIFVFALSCSEWPCQVLVLHKIVYVQQENTIA